MHVCLRHPETPAVGACDYCAEAHCAGCLTPFLGRRYCPECLPHVAAIARGAGPPPAQPQAAPTAPAMAGWLSAFLYAAAFLVVQLVVGIPMGIALAIGFVLRGHSPTGTDWLHDMRPLGLPLWTAIFGVTGWVMLGAVLGLTALMARFVERRGLGDLGLRWSPVLWRDALLGPALAAAMLLTAIGPAAAAGWYAVEAAGSMRSLLEVVPCGVIALLPFAAVEEITVRGYVLPALARSWGTLAAVGVSSALFALLHGLNPGVWQHPFAILGLFLAGVYLASAYLVTGDLWLAIFAHLGWNLAEGPLLGLPVSGLAGPASVFHLAERGPDLWTGGAFGPEAGLLVCLATVLHIGLLWTLRPWLRRGRSAPAAPQSPPAAAS